MLLQKPMRSTDSGLVHGLGPPPRTGLSSANGLASLGRFVLGHLVGEVPPRRVPDRQNVHRVTSNNEHYSVDALPLSMEQHPLFLAVDSKSGSIG